MNSWAAAAFAGQAIAAVMGCTRGHGLAPEALKKLSRLLSQLPEQYRAVPNIGIIPERLGDLFRITVRRHLTWDENCWNCSRWAWAWTAISITARMT